MPALRCRIYVGAMALLLLGVAAELRAQVSAPRLVVENDHFTYWLPRDQRPDREYTSGVISHFPLRLPVSAPSLVSGGADPCTGRESRHTRCTVASARLGQKIYTPTPWRPRPDERPYAGWLFGGVTVAQVTAVRRRTFDLEVGVTGRPSFGEHLQTEVHRRMGHGTPKGWDEQIGFEPAFALRVAEGAVLLGTSPRAAVGAVVSGGVGATVGTLRTAADASLEARAGVRPPHPWWPGGGSTSGPIAAYGIGGVTQHVVARDLMLDGSTFREAPAWSAARSSPS
jgi:hypothetical protein